MNNKSRSGFTLVELLVSLGLVSIIFTGIFLSYSTILDTITNAELRTAAVSALNKQIEIIRNLPYDQVGVVGSYPSGIIPFTQTVSVGNIEFSIKTTVRNIDDPFDGTIGGNPNDTAPADYKLVEFEASCPRCSHFVPFVITTTVAPKNLESSGSAGSLFVNIFNASGGELAGKQVRVLNMAINPTIDINDVTNNNGVLQLVGLPTSTQSYQVVVTNAGYTSEKTYTPGAPENPNPINSHMTVASGQLTTISFLIDKISAINVSSSNAMCSSSPNINFSIAGSKPIGTSPDILKFSTTTDTDSLGSKTFQNIEWDSYDLTFNGSYLRGTIPLPPLNIIPDTAYNFRFVTASPDPNALLVTVKNLAGSGISGANVGLSKSGFSKNLVTGEDKFSDTDWSGSNYDSKSAGIDTDSEPGVTKLALSGGTYSTTTVEWLISKTFDVGSSTSNFYLITWNPLSQLPQTGEGSLRFQIAANNDNSTWNFVGPDGTSGTYYDLSGFAIPQYNNKRYLRYKIYLKTTNESFTPKLEDITISFSSMCVPPAQVLFGGLAADTYDILVTASGYANGTSTVLVGSGFEQTEVVLTPL